MSQENARIVGLAHEYLNEGDINGLIALCDGDFELDMSARALNPETYRGHAGIRRFYSRGERGLGGVSLGAAALPRGR